MLGLLLSALSQILDAFNLIDQITRCLLSYSDICISDFADDFSCFSFCKMRSKLLVAASVSLAQCAPVAEASLRGDPNQVGYAVDRFNSFHFPFLTTKSLAHAFVDKIKFSSSI